MTESQTSRQHSLATHLVPLRKSQNWLLGVGIALIALGTLGLFLTGLFSIASAYTFGILSLIGGGMMLVEAFRAEGWGGRIWHILIGVLYIAVGGMIVFNPVAGAVALTLIAGWMLVAIGVVRCVLAFRLRPAQVWVWVLVSGILSVLLGVLVIAGWPASSYWVLGTFMAIELIFQGWSHVMLSQAIRSTHDGVITRRPAPPSPPPPAPSPGSPPTS